MSSAFAIRGFPTLDEVFYEAFEGGDFDCCPCAARELVRWTEDRRFTCPRCRKAWIAITDYNDVRGWEEVLP